MICRICKKEFSKKQFGEPYQDICSNKCFSRQFWIEFKKDYEKQGSRRVVIDHNGYLISLPVSEKNTRFAGYAGKKFYILKDNGEKVYTNNLNHNGKIPEDLWDEIPDNAVFTGKDWNLK